MLRSILQVSAPTGVTGATLVAYVLLDVFLIVTLARILGALMRKVGQPRVVGEIVAGILLGPTLLGPDLSFFIAPAPARPVLAAISTIALVLFMFLAGVEYDRNAVRGRATQAGVLALLSIGLPALLGFPVGFLMHNSTFAGPRGAELLPFALFIGAALSVTAFPVMAHILMERGELNSRLGALGVATTAIMSVLMFLYIAFAGVVATSAGTSSLILRLVLVASFILGSWFICRPLLARWLAPTNSGQPVTADAMGLVFPGLVLYGFLADRIGINALVGGFLWGLIMPEAAGVRAAISGKVKDVAMILLLPVFFAFAGFNTDLKLMTRPVIPVMLMVLAAAIGGKFLAVVPARAFGLSWNETATLGALFNTRGLLVLVAGLIGLQLQIITIATFTIIVVVALVTNLMTLPCLNALERRRRAKPADRMAGPIPEHG